MLSYLDLMSTITYTMSKMIPKKKNRWVFGAWYGTAVSDNTKAFYDYINSNYPDIEKIWIAEDPKKHKLDGCKFVKRNSLKSLWYITTAKVAVMNQGYGDFNAFNFLGNCFTVQLWHGVAWKKIILDAMPNLSKMEKRMFCYTNKYSLYIAPSNNYRDVVLSAFNTTAEKVLMIGQPRNEQLFREDFCEQSREYIKKKYLISESKKIIVYMPTFRDKTDDVFSFMQESVAEEISKLAKELNIVILEKSHYKNSCNRKEENKNSIISVPGMDANTLLAAADMLITDYSSCFFDFLIRNKPIIHFVYDYDYYKNKDRGLYYDIDEVASGCVAYNTNELIEAISNNISDPDLLSERRNKVKDAFVTYESENNSALIMKEIIRRTACEWS